MLNYKMCELKNIAVKTKSESLTDDCILMIVADVLKYDRIYITNLISKRLLDSIR